MKSKKIYKQISKKMICDDHTKRNNCNKATITLMLNSIFTDNNLKDLYKAIKKSKKFNISSNEDIINTFHIIENKTKISKLLSIYDEMYKITSCASTIEYFFDKKYNHSINKINEQKYSRYLSLQKDINKIITSILGFKNSYIIIELIRDTLLKGRF